MTTKTSFRLLSPHEVPGANTLLLDVRTPAEYEAAHVPGSVLHPLQSLDPAAIFRLAAGHDTCVLICGSGQRARLAAEKLSSSGLPTLSVLDGGLTAWEAAGLPLQRGHRRVISLERQVRIAAGTLVFTGALLTWLVNPWFLLLPAFVGAGLIFAGVTDFCGMALLLARLPWNQSKK